MQPTTVNPSQTSQAIMMRKPVSFLPSGVMALAYRRLPPSPRFEQNYRPDGHTTQRYRFLVALRTLFIAYSLILFSSYIVCMHILIDGCHWNTTPSHLHHRIPPLRIMFLPTHMSIPTTSHSLFSATYNHQLVYIATASVWYPRFHAHLRHAEVPTNLFSWKKDITKLVPEIASPLVSNLRYCVHPRTIETGRVRSESWH